MPDRDLTDDEREVLQVLESFEQHGYLLTLRGQAARRTHTGGATVLDCLRELEALGLVVAETFDDGPRWRPTAAGEAAVLAERVDEGGVPC